MKPVQNADLHDVSPANKGMVTPEKKPSGAAAGRSVSKSRMQTTSKKTSTVGKHVRNIAPSKLNKEVSSLILNFNSKNVQLTS